MVIINLRKENEGFDAEALTQAIRDVKEVGQGTARKNRRIQVLAAVDHDGVLAAKIMTFLLNQLNIDYSLRPVRDNDDISRYITQAAGSSEPPKSIITLNCGANYRWEDNFEDKGVVGDVNVIVIDSHRPVILSNVSSNRVLILDDDPFNLSNKQIIPSDSEPESESEEYSQPEDSQISRKRVRNADDGRAVKKSRIKEYYEKRGTFFVNPAAVTVYMACNFLHYRCCDMLWCACVSLSAHYDLGMISSDAFGVSVIDLLRCHRCLSDQVGEESNFDDIDPDVVTRNEDDMHYPIVYNKEISAPLLRHWSLWEALYHTPYVFGRLHLHQEIGKNNLKEFFAQCDILPLEYSDQYKQMSWDIRRDLIERCERHREDFRMPDIVKYHLSRHYPDVPKNAPPQTPSTVSQLGGYEGALILYALLENDIEATIPETVHVTANPPVELLEEVRACLYKGIISNFHRAYDTALFRNYALVSEGLYNAIQIQELLVRQGNMILQGKLNPRVGDYFRCAVVKHVVDPIFRRPSVARRLALWLVDTTLRAEERLPQLVAVQDPLRRIYLCVGVPARYAGGRPRSRDEYRTLNKFSKILQDTVRLSQVRAVHKAFDEASIEIYDVDFPAFRSALQRSYGEDDRMAE